MLPCDGILSQVRGELAGDKLVTKEIVPAALYRDRDLGSLDTPLF
jgi:hypothetical protein